jgi:chromosome segregation ATPase
MQKDYVLTTNAKDAIETAYQIGLQVAGTGIINTRTIADHETRIAYIEAYDIDYISREVTDLGHAVSDIEQTLSNLTTSTTGGDDLIVIDQQISTLNNRVTLLENNTTTNTTKIGVHTTDIASLLNRIVDLETTVQTQSRLISELTTRLEALEQK